MRREIRCRLLFDCGFLFWRQSRLQLRDDLFSQFVLNPKYVGQIPIIVFPPKMRVGSRIEFAAQFLGRRLTYTYEVAEFVPGKRLVMRTAEGPFPMETTYTWATVGGGTLMTLRNRGDRNGLGAVLSLIMAPAVRRATQRDLGRLKELLEKGP